MNNSPSEWGGGHGIGMKAGDEIGMKTRGIKRRPEV